MGKSSGYLPLEAIYSPKSVGGNTDCKVRIDTTTVNDYLPLNKLAAKKR